MSRFTLEATPLDGLVVVWRHPLGDARGYLQRIFCPTELATLWDGLPVRQVNHTLTQAAGTLRGMHFQWPPQAEKKLVSCLRGAVYDVAVDVRAGSPTFLQHYAVRLEASRPCSLLIPEGFAHGFQTLTPDCELLYLHSADFAPTAEGGLDALDPRLAIDWPLAVSERSARDSTHPRLTDAFAGVVVS